MLTEPFKNDSITYYFYIFVGFCVAFLYLRIVYRSNPGMVYFISLALYCLFCKQ